MKPSDVRILIVDDEPMIVETIANLFQMYQFNVDTAESGNQAWKLLEKDSYDLVLSDIRMPDGDGIELTKKIKSRNANRPSVLFMSGFSDILNEEIYHVGAEGKFAKPFDVKAVRLAIQTSLLVPEAKWARSPSVSGRMTTIEKAGVDLIEMEEQRSVLFGRGGFFIASVLPAPEKGSSVIFSIKVENPTPINFKGIGIVRWSQSKSRFHAPAGLGIEIINMAEIHSKRYNQLFGHRIPFIPSPSLASKSLKSADPLK